MQNADNQIVSSSLTTDYVAVYAGASRWTPFTNPYEQISRIVGIKTIPNSKAAFLLLESHMTLNEYVNPICLPSLLVFDILQFIYRNLVTVQIAGQT